MRVARTFVKSLDDRDKVSVDEARRIAFTAVWNALTEAQQGEVLEELTRTRKHFERSSTPGHATWYPIHLQVEAFVEGLLFPETQEENETDQKGRIIEC